MPHIIQVVAPHIRQLLRRPAILFSIISIAACANADLLTGDTQQPDGASKDSVLPTPGSIAGSYVLVKFGQSVLPADLGLLPPRDPGMPMNCHREVRSGGLLVHASQEAYEYIYDVFNTCNGSLLQRGGANGRLERVGATLRFIANVGAGQVETHLGSVRGDSVWVTDQVTQYLFVRVNTG